MTEPDSARLPDRASTRSAWFEPALPRLLAHRGLAVDAPENTLLAFVKALAAGATYLETDVHASKDGVAVLSHDPNLVRMAGRRVRVNELTLKELRKIDLGEGQSFSTLSELLDAFPEARFNIDIKSLDAARPAAEAILKAKATGRVLITSFNRKRRHAAVRLMPGVASSPSPGEILLAVLAAKLRLSAVVKFAFRHVTAVQVPVRGAGVRIATRGVISRFHAAGLEVHIWTINDVATMKRLLDLGVDGLFTDRIDLALGLLRDGNAASA
ncbi:MAG TPA: glycerophosphodiester phosphodiesterase [Galbitalea sp.]|nr:glycerophosphodiester phosphodiesterase [Galbitalea sp.]